MIDTNNKFDSLEISNEDIIVEDGDITNPLNNTSKSNENVNLKRNPDIYKCQVSHFIQTPPLEKGDTYLF